MDLTTYVRNLGREFATLAEAGGDEARALVERLTGSLESAIRMTLLEALSAAADEITRDLAPGSVELRLRGREPNFVVTPPPGERFQDAVEEAAGLQGRSVNAWLVRAAAAALRGGDRDERAEPRAGKPAKQRFTGWV